MSSHREGDCAASADDKSLLYSIVGEERCRRRRKSQEARGGHHRENDVMGVSPGVH